MKRRLVKKFSRAFRDRPNEVTNTHWRYCMRSWQQNFRKLSIAQQYAIKTAFLQVGITMAFLQAFGTRPLKKLTRLEKNMNGFMQAMAGTAPPTPKYHPGTILQTRSEIIRLEDGTLVDMNMNPVGAIIGERGIQILNLEEGEVVLPARLLKGDWNEKAKQ